MMAALGQFTFALNTLAFQELRRSTSWRHPSNPRVGARPARQFVGLGDETITLTGLQAPEFLGDRKALDRLRAMADKGSAYALVNGAGENFGAWVIESMDETGTLFVREGVPRRVEFTINGDGKPLTTIILKGTEPARLLECDVSQVSEVQLLLTGRGLDTKSNYAIWAEPTLIKK